MTDSTTRFPSGPKTRGKTAASMSPWIALLVLGAIGGIGGLLLWFGLAIVVRCDRVQDRVDVTVQRRFLGVLPLSTETVTDVVKAGVYVVRGASGNRRTRGSTASLELTARNGDVVRRGQFGPAFGSRPSEMADQIEQFIKEPSRPSLTTWWMPWLVNLGSLPFVLIIGGVVGERLLRLLGVIKDDEPGPSGARLK